MAESFVQAEGVALVDMALRLSDVQSVPFLGTNVAFIKAEFTETSKGFSYAVFTVETSTRDYVDNFLSNTMAGETPILRWRLGFGTPGGAATWMMPQDYIIQSYGAVREGIGNQSGYFVKIKTADQLWAINRIKRTTARQGSVSDIVQQIADFYKLAAVIEPTKVTGGYVQSFQSDYRFILERLVPRAVNAQKRGNYQFYVRDGTLHFHTIDFQASLKEFSYYDSPGTKLVQIDKTQDNVEIGSAGVRNVVIDPYTGDASEILASPQNTLRLANTAPDVENLGGAELNLMSSLGTNRLPDAQAINSNMFESSGIQSYNLQLTVPKTIYFRANDIVRMVIQPKAGATPLWNGLYHTSQVVYIVDKSSITASVDLHRGEYSSSGDSFAALAQVDQTAIQPQRAAGGQDPNLVSVVSSVLTKGSGNTVSRSRLLDTQNPADALSPNTSL